MTKEWFSLILLWNSAKLFILQTNLPLLLLPKCSHFSSSLDDSFLFSFNSRTWDRKFWQSSSICRPFCSRATTRWKRSFIWVWVVWRFDPDILNTSPLEPPLIPSAVSPCRLLLPLLKLLALSFLSMESDPTSYKLALLEHKWQYCSDHQRKPTFDVCICSIFSSHSNKSWMCFEVELWMWSGSCDLGMRSEHPALARGQATLAFGQIRLCLAPTETVAVAWSRSSPQLGQVADCIDNRNVRK